MPGLPITRPSRPSGSANGFLISGRMIEAEALFEPEAQVGLSGHAQLFAAGQRLCAGTSGSTSQSTDRCAFAAAGDRTDDGASNGTASDVLAGAFVLADAFLPVACGEILAVHAVALAVHPDGAQGEGQAFVIADGGQLGR